MSLLLFLVILIYVVISLIALTYLSLYCFRLILWGLLALVFISLGILVHIPMFVIFFYCVFCYIYTFRLFNLIINKQNKQTNKQTNKFNC
jgi:hypothetical protein